MTQEQPPLPLRLPQPVSQIKPVEYAFGYINSPFTKRQYLSRLKLFFDYFDLSGGDLEEQGQAFLTKTRENQQLTQKIIMHFLDFHKQRVLKKNLLQALSRTFIIL